MAVLCLLLTAACGFDYCKRKIPNVLVAVTALAGAAFRIRGGGAAGALYYLGAAAAVMAPLYPLYKIGALGAGDVKLLGAAAGYLPFQKIYLFSFVSLLIAAIISLVKLLANKNLGDRLGTFFRYLADTAKKGAPRPYPAPDKREKAASVCLSGPVLLSLLLYLGDIY